MIASPNLNIEAARAASVLNSLPHIDEVEDNLKERIADKRVPSTDGKTMYCLPHHHFKLKPGEVLVFDIIEGKDGIATTVKVNVSPYEEGMHPFQYYSDGNKYVPVGFTRQKKYACEYPKYHTSELGVISGEPFRNISLIETTDEAQRVQMFNKMDQSGGGNGKIVTTISPKGENAGGAICLHCIHCEHYR